MRYNLQQGVVRKIKNGIINTTLSAVLLVSGLGGSLPLFLTQKAAAASSSTVISGDTASFENDPGWMFNRDPGNTTPYEFTTQKHSTGIGSIYVKPIGTNAPDKFIAEDFGQIPISDLNSISYDYLVAGNGTAASANQFYLNVYANIDSSNNFYDCRFNYVPTTGSTSSFSTASFSPTSTPVNVLHRGTRIAACPATLAAMPAGSSVRMFSVNVGDTSASDTGLAGYLDNVVVNRTSGTNAYDFEPAPSVTAQDFGVGFWTVASNGFTGIDVGFRTDNFTHVDGIKVTLQKNGSDIVSNTASAALLNDINTPGGVFNQNGQISTPFVTDGSLNDTYCGGISCWNADSHVWLASDKPDAAVITVTQNGVDYPATISNLSEVSGTFDSIIPQDTEVPTVSFTSPSDGKVFNNTPSFELKASDDVAIRNVTSTLYDSANNRVGWKVLAGNLDAPTFTTSGPVTYDTSGTPLPDGDYTMVAAVQDMYGKYGQQAVLHVHIDHVAPSVPTLLSPVDRGYTKTNDFNFDWTDSTDANPSVTYEFQSSLNSHTTNDVLDTNVWDSLANGQILTTSQIHSTGAPDGTWYWQVRAIDAAGNKSAWTTVWHMTIDTKAPATTLNIANLVNGYVTSRQHNNKLTITGHATDNLGMNRVLVQLLTSKHGAIENHTLYLSGASQDWSTDFNIQTLGLADGGYSVVAVVTDNAGNTSAKGQYLNFTLDNTRPTIDFTSPTDFSTPFQVGPTLTIEVSDPNGSGVDPNNAVLHVYNASDDSPTSAWCNHATICDTSNLLDGNYYVKAGVTDNAGNNQTVTKFFTIDGTPPVITDNFTVNMLTNESRTLQPTVTDHSSPLTYQWSVSDQKLLQGNPSQPLNGTSLQIGSAPKGDYTVTLTVTDLAGNATTKTYNVTISTPANSNSATTQGLVGGRGGGNAGNNLATTDTAASSVLGAQTDESNAPKSDDKGQVKGDTVELTTDTNKDTSKDNSNFLGLGWWWLLVLGALAAFLLFLFRRSDSDDKA